MAWSMHVPSRINALQASSGHAWPTTKVAKQCSSRARARRACLSPPSGPFKLFAATTPADPADRPLDLPLWIYHEESHDGQPLPGVIREWANDKHVCLVDLFHVVPELHHWLHSNASCIDAFYKIAGHSEPFE